MSAPGIPRITGYENGVWTVPSIDGVSLMSIEHPAGPETTRQDINPQSTETIEIELGLLPLIAALESPEKVFGPYAEKSLRELCKLAAAELRALETENQDLRTDITIMGNVLDDYANGRSNGI